jgi:hypothetical protein
MSQVPGAGCQGGAGAGYQVSGRRSTGVRLRPPDSWGIGGCRAAGPPGFWRMSGRRMLGVRPGSVLFVVAVSLHVFLEAGFSRWNSGISLLCAAVDV